MFDLYITLYNAIRSSVAGLRTLDLDKGQLDYPESFESLSLPAVLISTFDINWQPTGGRNELGEGTVTLKTIVRLPSRTHDTDPLIDANVSALSIVDTVHEAVMAVGGITSRVKSSAYPVAPFYVVEQTYAGVFRYARPTRTVTVPVNTTLSLNHP